MLWPDSLKVKVVGAAKAQRISMTEVVLRLIGQAEQHGVLDEWISRPPPSAYSLAAMEGESIET